MNKPAKVVPIQLDGPKATKPLPVSKDLPLPERHAERRRIHYELKFEVAYRRSRTNQAIANVEDPEGTAKTKALWDEYGNEATSPERRDEIWAALGLEFEDLSDDFIEVEDRALTEAEERADQIYTQTVRTRVAETIADLQDILKQVGVVQKIPNSYRLEAYQQAYDDIYRRFWSGEITIRELLMFAMNNEADWSEKPNYFSALYNFCSAMIRNEQTELENDLEQELFSYPEINKIVVGEA